MAVGVLRAASEHGLSIPKDLTIIGFSNAPISSQKKLDLIEKNGYAKTVKMDRNDYSVHKKQLNEKDTVIKVLIKM